MDSVKIRELEEKSIISPEDTMVVEDNSGTLQVPVSSLQTVLQSSLYCRTINDLKQSVFNAGDVVQTLGYHTAGDGGMATYLIVDAPDELDNGITIIPLLTSDKLKAHLLYDNYVSPMQGGAYGDGEQDDSQVIEDMQTLGLPIKFPKRTFYATIYMNSTDEIDFNGCTIVSEDSCIIAAPNTVIENVTLGSKEDTSIVVSDCDNVAIRNCSFISYNGRYDVSIINSGGISISNCIFTEPSTDAGTIIYINNNSNRSNRVSIHRCIFSNIHSIAIETSGFTTIDDCIINAADNSVNYNIIAFGYCSIKNSVLTGRPAIVANTNSKVSISNITIDNAASGIMLLNNSTVEMSKLMDFTSNNKIRSYVIGQSQSNSQFHLNGYIIQDSKTVPYDTGDCKVYSFINNNSYDEALPGMIYSVGSDMILDIRNTLSGINNTMVNAAIRFNDQSTPLTKITNGIDGQVIALYGNNSKISVNNKDNTSIREVDNDRLTLSPSVPLYLKYKRGTGWSQIK